MILARRHAGCRVWVLSATVHTVGPPSTIWRPSRRLGTSWLGPGAATRGAASAPGFALVPGQLLFWGLGVCACGRVWQGWRVCTACFLCWPSCLLKKRRGHTTHPPARRTSRVPWFTVAVGSVTTCPYGYGSTNEARDPTEDQPPSRPMEGSGRILEGSINVLQVDHGQGGCASKEVTSSLCCASNNLL